MGAELLLYSSAILATGAGALLGQQLLPLERRGLLANRFLKKQLGIAAIGWPDGIKEYLVDYSKPGFRHLDSFYVFDRGNAMRKGGLQWTYFDPKDTLSPKMYAVLAEAKDEQGNALLDPQTQEVMWTALVPGQDIKIVVPKSLKFSPPPVSELGRDPQFVSALNSKQKIVGEAGGAKTRKQMWWMNIGSILLLVALVALVVSLSADLSAMRTVVLGELAKLAATCAQGVPQLPPPPVG